MGLTRTVAPTTTPITLTEAKQHLRVISNAEDSLIVGLIGSATRACEAYLSRQLVTATYALTLDDFPGGFGIIRIDRTPVQSISSITYVDANGTTQTLSTDAYELVATDVSALVVLKPGQSWPSVQSAKYAAVTVTFIAGYTAVPDEAKAAVKLMVGHLFNHRDATTEQTLNENQAVGWLLDSIAVPKVI